MSFPATRLSIVERTRSLDEETRRVAWAAIIEDLLGPDEQRLRQRLTPSAAIKPVSRPRQLDGAAGLAFGEIWQARDQPQHIVGEVASGPGGRIHARDPDKPLRQ